MDKRKVAAITDWPVPTRLKEVQSFHGFANFYRRFINGFSCIVQPLIILIRKDTPFLWKSAAQSAFDALQAAFLTTLVLVHPDPTRPFQVETDASDFAIGAVLSQPDDEEIAEIGDERRSHMCVGDVDRKVKGGMRSHTVRRSPPWSIKGRMRHL